MPRIIVLVVWTVTLWTTGAALAEPTALKAQVDRQVMPLVEAGDVVGLVVGVVQNGQSHVFAYGEVQKGSGQAPTEDTIYEIGSVTKVFTGILLADAASRGAMDLDDPISKHLPRRLRVPEFEDQPIRLVHLATHTSGLPRLPDNMAPSDPLDPYADYSAQMLYSFVKNHQLGNPPGARWEYSNLGGGLLGHILARNADKSYEAVVIERICQPLGMDDTVITLSDAQRSRLAPPYNHALESDKNWEFDVLAGAGALRSTCADMLKFITAQFDERDSPLTTAMQAALEIHHQAADSSPAMGLGWLRARDGTTYMHGGTTGGYCSNLAIVPAQKFGAVVLTNTATDALDVVAEKIVQTLYGMDVEPYQPSDRPTEVELDPAVLQQYTGYYRLAPTFGINVTFEQGQLMVQATDQPKFPIFASSDTEFFLKVVDAQITFVRGEDGAVEKLILHQGGQHLECQREEPSSAASGARTR